MKPITIDGERFPAPTTEQVTALREYANQHGRTWKQQLSLAWFSAGEPGILQQIRNEFGPSWLIKFRLPAEHIDER